MPLNHYLIQKYEYFFYFYSDKKFLTKKSQKESKLMTKDYKTRCLTYHTFVIYLYAWKLGTILKFWLMSIDLGILLYMCKLDRNNNIT